MKHSVIVFAFAAVLGAQQGQGQGTAKPQDDLAAVIAVEEQERDLAKAEKLYRELLGDAKLAATAREQANLRLGRLLQKLGRAEEAKPFLAATKGNTAGFDDFGPGPSPQDVEREKALREKARGIVEQILKQGAVFAWEPPLHGVVNRHLAEQLLWIGEAAVPEVIAALQAEQAGVPASWSPQEISPVKALAGFLWRTGGTLAAVYMHTCSKVEDVRWRAAIVSTAFQAQHPTMLAEAIRFLDDPDPTGEVVRALLESNGREGPPLQSRLDPARIVEAALRGPATGKVRMLRWAMHLPTLDESTLGSVHDMVAEGLRSTDPELGTAANLFLLSTTSQSTPRGMQMLLQELPRMKGQDAPQSPPQPSPTMRLSDGRITRYTPERAAVLLPLVDACARALAAISEVEPNRRRWLEQRMIEIASACDASVVPTVLAWMDLGYYVWYGLHGKIDAANALEVFARFDRIASRERVQFLDQFARLDLPDASFLFRRMRTAADRLRGDGDWTKHVPNPLEAFATAMAKTGDPAAADWIVAQGEPSNWMVQPLVQLGRRSRDDNMLDAMRKVAAAGIPANRRAELLLALLALHDEPSLDRLVGLAYNPMQATQPYATKPEPFHGSPLQYLVYQNPDPPHGFTEDQVIDVLRKIAANGIPQDWEPRFWSHPAIPDRVLGEIAKLTAAAAADSTNRRDAYANWTSLVLERLRRSGGSKDLESWLSRMLRHESAAARLLVLELMREPEVARERALVEARLDDDEERCAGAAAGALLRHGTPPLEISRLLRNKHPGVRLGSIEHLATRVGSDATVLVRPMTKDPSPRVRKVAAQHLGAVVDKEAVPALIEMLRDADAAARTAAADALTRIRFYHEQQAHWDRVLKGLDASPASAAEKLLLQAKPGAAKDQRLLAITSLGTLGAPEALPFLIEWTQDPDAELAAAAKAAITQIHLNPRR
ncbi:MAG: HEAT repeat domain-containing protein [Planctomycetota bacterium]